MISTFSMISSLSFGSNLPVCGDNAFADATEVNALISGTEFELKESTWGSGSSVFYWPATDQVSFFAFSPNTTEQFSWGAAAAKTAPTLTYTVKDAVKDQEDLVVAEAMNKQKATSGSTEAVALNFKHALTKVGFKIKGEGSGVTYTLNKIVINAKNYFRLIISFTLIYFLFPTSFYKWEIERFFTSILFWHSGN